MKITKRQLKRVIKEEKAKLIAETEVRRVVRRRLREAMDGGGTAMMLDDGQSNAYLEAPDGSTLKLNTQATILVDESDISAWASELGITHIETSMPGTAMEYDAVPIEGQAGWLNTQWPDWRDGWSYV